MSLIIGVTEWHTVRPVEGATWTKSFFILDADTFSFTTSKKLIKNINVCSFDRIFKNVPIDGPPYIFISKLTEIWKGGKLAYLLFVRKGRLCDLFSPVVINIKDLNVVNKIHARVEIFSRDQHFICVIIYLYKQQVPKRLLMCIFKKSCKQNCKTKQSESSSCQ